MHSECTSSVMPPGVIGCSGSSGDQAKADQADPTEGFPGQITRGNGRPTVMWSLCGSSLLSIILDFDIQRREKTKMQVHHNTWHRKLLDEL